MSEELGSSHGLDIGTLETYLRETLPPGMISSSLEVELLAGGKSNLTYRVTSGDKQLVVRRPPMGHVLQSAHDMAREFEIQRALLSTLVPVPRVLALEDESVLGSPFYVMEYVEGIAYRTSADVAALTAVERHTLSVALVDNLVAIHGVDPGSVGLEAFGRPEGFLERQVALWGRQLERSRHRELDGDAALLSELSRRLPVSPSPAIVHGDYRLDNVLFRGTDVVATLDWEMATLGDPLTDLAMTLLYRDRVPVGDSDPMANPMLEPGFASSDDMASHYAAATGADLSNLSWYLALANFKLAVIMEGIHARYVAGLTVGDGFDHVGDMVQPLLDRGREYVEALA